MIFFDLKKSYDEFLKIKKSRAKEEGKNFPFKGNKFPTNPASMFFKDQN